MKKTAIIFSILAAILTSASFIYDFQLTSAESLQGWGLKRAKEEGGIPEVPQKIKDSLANNGGVWIGNNNEKKLYLTFDCGYEAGYTPKILDALKATDVKATFFVVGHMVDKNPDLIKRMHQEGHIIGNHTDNHIVMPQASDEKNIKEIKSLEEKVNTVLEQNYTMSYLRPPKGEYNERTLKIAQNMGYKTVFWSSAYVDWQDNKKGDLDYSFNMITKQFHNGSIILLHNTSSNNADVLERIINDAKSKGYVFANLNEL